MGAVEIASPYPTELLEHVDSVALVFGAGFGGANDGCHVRAAGVERVLVIDSDPVAVDAMQHDYPEWSYLCVDAFRFARSAQMGGHRWDLVSADLPSSLPLEMVDALPLWCAIARRYVVSTVMRHNFPGAVDSTAFTLPEGWRFMQLLNRSWYRGGAWWLVLERAS